MMRRAILLSLLPVAVGATPYDGIYRQNANADCGLIGVDGGSVEIRGNIFYGVETECNMTRPVDVVDMDATLYTFVCSGDDELWSERVMIMNGAEEGKIYMIWDGYAFTYDQCVAPATSADATTETEAQE